MRPVPLLRKAMVAVSALIVLSGSVMDLSDPLHCFCYSRQCPLRGTGLYSPVSAAALMRIMREDIISMERKFIRDHAKRSRENYELLKSSGSPTAALIDSLIGLLILPSQKLFDEIAQDIVDDASLLENILSECSTGPTTRSPRSLFQVIQHLRSSAAHKAITVSAEILPEPGRPVSVDWLTFKDQNNRESTTVEITMSVETLEQFFYAFSDAAASL